MQWMENMKVTSLWQILKALPLDDGPDTTRAIVLTVNAAVSLGLLGCYATLCAMCLRHDATEKAGVIVTLAGVAVSITTAALGFAMSMQKARDALRTQAVVKETAADGASSLTAVSTGG